MTERAKPNARSTVDCILAARSVIAGSKHLLPEVKVELEGTLQNMADLVQKIESGDVTAARAARAAGDISEGGEVNYGNLIQRMQAEIEKASRTDVLARISKERMLTVQSQVDELTDGDLVQTTLMYREMIEPTATRGQGIVLPEGTGNILNEVDTAASKALGRVYKALQKMSPGIIDTLKGGKDTQFSRAVQLLLEGGKPASKTISKKELALAQEFVKIFREETASLIDRANKAGHDITFSDLWGVRNYSGDLIRQRSQRDFIDWFAPKLAGSPDSAEVIASNMWVNAHEMTGVSSLKSRKLHFKTPQDAADVFAELSDRSISDMLQKNVGRLAKVAVWSEKFGPMGERAFIEHLEQIGKSMTKTELEAVRVAESARTRNPLARVKPDKLVQQTISQVKFHSGTLAADEVSSFVTAGGTMRNMVAAGLLKAVGMYTIFSDIPKGALRAFQLGGSNGRAAMESFKYMGDVINAVIRPSHYAQALEHLDTMQAGMLAAQASDLLSVRTGAGGKALTIAHRLSTKEARLNYRINIVDRLSNASYIGNQMSTLRTLARSGKTLDDVGNFSPELRNSLQKAGVTDTMWEQINDAAHHSGGTLDPTKITDPKVRNVIAGWQRAESFYSISRPDNYTSWRFETLGGRATDAKSREVIRMATQFFGPQFAVGRGLIRTINSAGAYGIGGKIAYTGGAVATLIAGGIGHTQLTRQLKNQPLYDMDDPLLILEAIDRSGLVFLMGGIGSHIGKGMRTGRGGDIGSEDLLQRGAAPLPMWGMKNLAGAAQIAAGWMTEDEGLTEDGFHDIYKAAEMFIPKTMWSSAIGAHAYGGSLLEQLEDHWFEGKIDNRERHAEKVVDQP